MSFVNVQDRRLPFAVRYLGDLMSYRHLCWNLVGSDLRSRFRRTRLGVLWAVIQPLAFALMIAFVWGALSRTGNYWEFALYVLVGMTAFELFGAALSGGQDAIANAAGFVKQARIPLFVFQLRVVLSASANFLFAMIGVVIFGLAIGGLPAPGLHLLLLPAFLVVAVLFALPITIIMSLLGALYRDVRHISGLAERAIFLLSPVMLPREVLEQPQLKFMEFLNPIVPFLDMFRDPLVHGRLWDQQDVLVMSVWIVGLWAIALLTSGSVGRRVVFAI